MNAKEIDQDLVKIIEVKNKLADINYNDSAYDQVEEELHDREDDFIDKYGDYLDQALKKVHERHLAPGPAPICEKPPRFRLKNPA